MTPSPAPSLETSLDAVARLLTRRVGHQLDATRQSRLSRAAAEEASRLGLAIHEYVDVVASDAGVLQSLLNRITVQETAFFRDANQFHALARDVLPPLPRPLSIWSAGCSNGQEPYSVAMVLAESGDRESRVIATDISTAALTRARRGCYSARDVADLGSRRERFFAASGADFQVRPELRDRVDFFAHNLFTEPPPFPQGSCSIVLCRNVLIYFGREAMVSFVDRVADWLAPGGWLFLGYSESLWQVTDRFDLVRLGDAFVYRRADARRPAGRRAGRTNRARRETGADRSERARPGPEPRVPKRTPVRAPRSRPGVESALPVDADAGRAVIAYRKVVYMHPDQPIAYLHLGLALEATGDSRAARRAFGAARAALDRADSAEIESALEGYSIEELSVLLDAKMVAPS